MAWIDDRIWCHPKFTDVSDRSAWTWVKGVAYSTGMATSGVLTAGQQQLVGADKRVRRELVTAGLWDEVEGSDAIVVHDWDVHNSKRDARRAADRERKKVARDSGQKRGASAGTSAGRARGSSGGGSTVAARVDGSEGSEEEPRAVTSTETTRDAPDETNSPSIDTEHILKAVDW